MEKKGCEQREGQTRYDEVCVAERVGVAEPSNRKRCSHYTRPWGV